jgi:hypothetical protein
MRGDLPAAEEGESDSTAKTFDVAALAKDDQVDTAKQAAAAAATAAAGDEAAAEAALLAEEEAEEAAAAAAGEVEDLRDFLFRIRVDRATKALQALPALHTLGNERSTGG